MAFEAPKLWPALAHCGVFNRHNMIWEKIAHASAHDSAQIAHGNRAAVMSSRGTTCAALSRSPHLAHGFVHSAEEGGMALQL